MKPQLQRITATLEKLDHEYQVATIHPSFAINSQNFAGKKNKTTNLSLPKIKSIPLSNHRNAANPALARNILKEIDTKIATWQDKLTRIQREIQALYLEGPIVDGWLESHPQSLETEQTRTAKDDKLMDYVEEMNTGEVSYQSPKAGYRLCGLDEQGKLWSKECPQEEVGELSVAIARYQKLKQLLYQKRTLETRLHQLAETLVILHSNITGNTNYPCF
jgi:hypothetical protein